MFNCFKNNIVTVFFKAFAGIRQKNQSSEFIFQGFVRTKIPSQTVTEVFIN